MEYFDFLYEFFSRQKVLSSTQIHINRYGSNIDYGESSKHEENYILADDTSHLIWYKNRILFVSKTGCNFDRISKIEISVPFGTKSLIDSLLKNIKEEYHKSSNTIQIRTSSGRDYWKTTHHQKRRFETVILSKDTKNTIIDDIEWFLDNREWYSNKDLHYHRGYLFSGPPGTGKSSLVAAVASKLNLKIYSFPVEKLSQEGFSDILYNVEKNSIVLIEDIDRLSSIVEEKMKQKKEKKIDPEELLDIMDGYSAKKQVSSEQAFRNLLQIMDGFQTPEAVIFILTANEPEKIDATLLRSGRIDKRFDFHYADSWQAEKMFLRFFENEKDLAKQFGEKFFDYYPKDTTASQLQERLLEAIKEGNPMKMFTKLERTEKNYKLKPIYKESQDSEDSEED